jgi:AbrB family looped-hinge helix DNA binding protein
VQKQPVQAFSADDVGIVKFVGVYYCSGKVMVETTVKLDEKGRVRIPKQIREVAKLEKGSCVNIKAKGKTIIIELAEPVADKYYGAFRVEKWPEDVDKYTAEEMQKRWKHRGT